MAFNESQLKRTAFAEAFTPELKTHMEEGIPINQHYFKKKYDGDKVGAALHLKIIRYIGLLFPEQIRSATSKG